MSDSRCRLNTRFASVGNTAPATVELMFVLEMLVTRLPVIFHVSRMEPLAPSSNVNPCTLAEVTSSMYCTVSIANVRPMPSMLVDMSITCCHDVVCPEADVAIVTAAGVMTWLRIALNASVVR